MSFQIPDDTLDLTGDPQVGKPIGSDIDSGKITLPVIAVLRQAGTTTASGCGRSCAAPTARHLAELQALLNRYGGVRYALDAARAFADRATAALEAIPASQAKESLRDLAAFVLVRAR
jgi:geranylgeranyl pyrophosphate synthase